MAGLSAAAALSADLSVTLLEREAHCGTHASGRSAAMFEENYGSPSTVALNKASKPAHIETGGGYLSPRGFLIIARAAEKEAFEKDAEDLGANPVSIDAACEILPILDRRVVALAAYRAEAYDIDTDRLLQDLRRKIQTAGCRIVTKAPVSAIQRTSTGWRLTAGGRRYTTPILVNAAGAWADEIARLAGLPPLGITPHRRSMARIAAPGGRDVTSWPMFFGTGETWYAKPDAGALIVSPADEDPLPPQDAWADDLVLAEGLDRYAAMVTEPVTRMLSNWAGLRSFAPDRALVLGPDPLDSAFVWSAGQGGYGFQTAPAAAALVADLILGRKAQLPAETLAALTPDRLRA